MEFYGILWNCMKLAWGDELDEFCGMFKLNINLLNLQNQPLSRPGTVSGSRAIMAIRAICFSMS